MLKFSLVLLSFFSIQCFAEDLTTLESKRSTHRKIASVVKKYAETLGCSFAFNPKNIVASSIHNEDFYLVLYSLDVGCSGGSAMNRPIFAAVKDGAYGKFVIDPRYSSPQQTSEDFPQMVTGIFTKKGQLWYKALDFDFAKDPLCCPSVPVVGRVKFEHGRWVAIPGH